VRDIIKAYYDKKSKKLEGQYTAGNKQNGPDSSAPAAAAQPQQVVKPEEAAVGVPAHGTNEANPR
jgi:hypothetical protein